MSSRICNNCSMQVSENAKFCSGCGNDLTREPTVSSKAQSSPSIIKSAKKGFSVGAKIGFGVGVIFFLILIAGAIAASNSGSTQSSSSDTTSEQQAIAFVQQYRGSSGTGYSISQIITLVVDIAYSGENILNNPSTEHGWTATKEYSENGNVWTVEFYFKTYRENIKIVWYANMDTHSVYSGDITAKSILDIVNLPSGSVSNSTLSSVHLT